MHTYFSFKKRSFFRIKLRSNYLSKLFGFLFIFSSERGRCLVRKSCRSSRPPHSFSDPSWCLSKTFRRDLWLRVPSVVRVTPSWGRSSKILRDEKFLRGPLRSCHSTRRCVGGDDEGDRSVVWWYSV